MVAVAGRGGGMLWLQAEVLACVRLGLGEEVCGRCGPSALP